MPKPKRRRTKEEYVHYVVTVAGWDYFCAFGVNGPSWLHEGPYSDIATLTLSGGLFRPEGHPCRKATVTLSGQTGLMAERDRRLGIGYLDSCDDVLRAHVFIPAERLSEIAAVAASGHVKAILVIGTRLRYRKGRVININVYTAFDEEEW